MGSRHSSLSGNKVNAIVNTISTVLVHSNLSCYVGTVNNVGISITNSGDVTIKNMTIISNGSSSMGDCSKVQNYNKGPLEQNVSNILDQMLSAAEDMNEDLLNFKAAIKQSVTVDVVDSCAVNAVDTAIISFANVKGGVVIDSVDIVQTASANLSQCLAQVSVAVGDTTKSLHDYIQENAHWLDVKTPDGQNHPAATSCTGALTSSKSMFTIVTIVAIIIALLLGSLSLAMAYYFRK